MKPIYNFILDSEHIDKYIIFTLICVYFYSVITSPITFWTKNNASIFNFDSSRYLDNLINWMKLVHSR